ncbi:MAG: Na/Pi cotransporter family protein [Butyricicoccaceae bacterium]
MNSVMETIFGLIGGLAIFIFGMNLMSESLQKVAGEKMKHILAMLTKNPVLGVLAGALCTAVLQSSSATTVMAIGFVSAGLMTLPQAISIILGANIGTTMTAQLMAFKISDYIFVFIFVGFIISFVAKKERTKNLGLTIFAFGLLFLGIETMGDVMKPLAASPVFTEMIGKVSDIPVLGVAVGTLMTLVVQSSSATIAVLQNFASQAGPDGVSSVMGLAGAIPVLLGDNIGTTITALLASVGQTKDAKRTALAHCTFNISGCLLFIWFVKPYAAFIQWLSPKGPEVEVISRQIANAHTGFNLIMTIIWIPFIWVLVKIVTRIIPDGKKGDLQDPAAPLYLDENIIGQPAAALELVAKEVIHCGEVVEGVLQDTILAVPQDKIELEAVSAKVSIARRLNNSITDYLADLFSAGVLTEEQATQTAGMMYVLSDVDRIGSLCGEVAESLASRFEQNGSYSDEAMESLQDSLRMIQGMYTSALRVIETGDQTNAESLAERKAEVLKLNIKIQKGHMNRVAEGKCAASLTAPFNLILHNIDRMGNSCVNIAEVASGQVDFSDFSNIAGNPVKA